MKSLLRSVNGNGVVYDVLAFACPGCTELVGGDGVHMLPVNTTEHSPSWDFDGNLEAPTLSPSIGSHTHAGYCHSFLRNGMFEFLADSDHSLAGTTVPIPDLPDWVVELGGR